MRYILINKLLLVLSFLIEGLLCIADDSVKQKQWPIIQEVVGKYRFILGEKEIFKMTVLDHEGFPLYCFDARFNAGEYGNGAYNFSGTFDCRLFPINPEKHPEGLPTLFLNHRNATRDWQTDARFLDRDLIGLIGARSSRYLIQRCKVQGMYIEMEINNVIADNEGSIKGLDFKITFINDPTAISEISIDDNIIIPEKLAKVLPKCIDSSTNNEKNNKM